MKYKSLQEFLEEHEVNWELFLENCKYENQGWEDSWTFYHNVKIIFKDHKKSIIDMSFRWAYSLQKNINWVDVENKWMEYYNSLTSVQKDILSFEKKEKKEKKKTKTF